MDYLQKGLQKLCLKFFRFVRQMYYLLNDAVWFGERIPYPLYRPNSSALRSIGSVYRNTCCCIQEMRSRYC